MAEVKKSFFIYLTLGILGVFALLFIGMALYPELKFRLMSGRLESDNLNERCDAFDYLCIQGKRGRNVIKDFCRRHTEQGWGKADVNLRLRIWTNVYCFQPKIITERTDLYNAFFYFEI
jgi:hypothetical protein